MNDYIVELNGIMKNKMKLNKKTMRWELRDNQELNELAIDLLAFMNEIHQEYYVLANLTEAFVDLMPCHQLYHSCRDDVKRSLKRLKKG